MRYFVFGLIFLMAACDDAPTAPARLPAEPVTQASVPSLDVDGHAVPSPNTGISGYRPGGRPLPPLDGER